MISQDNDKDPLSKTGPESEKELFYTMSKVCAGFPFDVVINATANILINVIRQSQSTRPQAERQIDELTGKIKTILLDQHYDSTGRRKGLYPYDQHIVVGHFENRSKL